MSKIVMLAPKNISMPDIKILRDVGGGSYLKIKQAAETNLPVAAYYMFNDDHDEVAEGIRQIVKHFGDYLDYYELDDHEEFDPSGESLNHKINAEIVRNILNFHDQVHQEMSNTEDEEV